MVYFPLLLHKASVEVLQAYDCLMRAVVGSTQNGMGSVKRVLAYGDSLTAGYHQHGMAFHPYANRLSAKIGSKVCLPLASSFQMQKTSAENYCAKSWLKRL